MIYIALLRGINLISVNRARNWTTVMRVLELMQGGASSTRFSAAPTALILRAEPHKSQRRAPTPSSEDLPALDTMHRRTVELPPDNPAPGPLRGSRRGAGRALLGRRALVLGGAVLLAVAGAVALSGGGSAPRAPEETPGTAAWAVKYFGNPDRARFKRRNIVEVEFLGRSMFVHRAASRHFLRLERLFEARAPEYAATVASGELDDWSYLNRDVRGEESKSNHAFGIAIDINALANPLGTNGDMPEEVVRQWEAEGGAWGGDWSRPDPMHFETHLTPRQIRARYRPDGRPRAWFLERITGD
jgi:hypothetical protein